MLYVSISWIYIFVFPEYFSHLDFAHFLLFIHVYVYEYIYVGANGFIKV